MSRTSCPAVLASLGPVSLLHALLVGSALQRQSHVHTRQCHSHHVHGWDQGSATRRVATRVPQHPLDWEQEEGKGGRSRQVTVQQKLLAGPTGSTFLPGKSCEGGGLAPRERLRSEDNPCGSDVQPLVFQHLHLIPGCLLLPFPFSPTWEGANLYNKHNQHKHSSATQRVGCVPVGAVLPGVRTRVLS